jgi:N-acetylglutamate synthase-like GNAT family acetyltransferase
MSVASVEIRRFSEPDAESVRSLILNIQRNEYGMSITADDQPDLGDMSGFFRNGAGDFWVAEQGAAIVGTVALLDIGGRRGALRKMFVDKAVRGPALAVADRLLDALLTSAKRGGLERIFLGTAEWFHAAHKFYRRRGFEEIAAGDLPAAFPVMRVDTRFFMLDLTMREDSAATKSR